MEKINPNHRIKSTHKLVDFQGVVSVRACSIPANISKQSSADKNIARKNKHYKPAGLFVFFTWFPVNHHGRLHVMQFCNISSTSRRSVKDTVLEQNPSLMCNSYGTHGSRTHENRKYTFSDNLTLNPTQAAMPIPTTFEFAGLNVSTESCTYCSKFSFDFSKIGLTCKTFGSVDPLPTLNIFLLARLWVAISLYLYNKGKGKFPGEDILSRPPSN